MQVLDHHHRVVALLERLGVEEGRQTRKRLGVVVDGDRDVLLVSAELVGDLVVEAVHEGGGRHGAEATGWLQERRRDGAHRPQRTTLHTHAHLSCHRWRRLLGLASVRRAPAPRPPGHLRRQPRNGVAGEHRAHPDGRLPLPARRHHRAVLRRRADRRRLPPGLAGIADRLPAPAAAHAQGRLARHPSQRSVSPSSTARASCSSPPARSTATRRSTRRPRSYWGNVNPIGPRGVYDEAKRYAEALTMAYHRQQGVDTAIVRIFNTYGAAHAPARRSRDPDLPAPGALQPADHGVRRRLADALLLLRRRPHPRASSRWPSPASTTR